MRIHFNGAAQIVTSSQYLLEVNGTRILVHGEPDAAAAFQERLRASGLDRFIYPELYASVSI